MNAMNKVREMLFSKAGAAVLAGLFLVFALALVSAPRNSTRDLHAETNSCPNAPTTATLNPYPITDGIAGQNCEDNRLISVRNVNSSDYSYQGDTSGQVGDEFYVRLYVHNGAAINLDPNFTTARNVSGSFSMHGGVILASAQGSNTNSVSGSASIQIPSGANLQYVDGSAIVTDYQGNPTSGNVFVQGQSGSFSFGDMPACFEYLRFIRFKVRVVGQAVQNPQGNISANLDGQVSGQCLWYARVSWSTQNADPVQVKVRDLTENGPEQLMAAAASSQAGGDRVDWIEPNHTYQFNLYTQGNFGQPFQSVTLSAPNLDCGGSIPQPGTGQIYAQVTNQLSGQCLYNGTVNWSTQNINSAMVTVDDLNDNLQANIHSFETQGNSETPWLTPGHTYRYILYDSSNGQTELDRTDVNVPSLNCGTPPPAQTPSGQISAHVTSQLSGQCLYNGTVSWSTQNVNSAQVTVDDLNDNLSANIHSFETLGNSETPWLTPGHTYRYILYNTSSGQTELDRTDVNVPSLNCGTPPPAQTPSGQINANVTGQVSGQCLYNGTVSWSTQNVNSAQVTVDDLDDNLSANIHSFEIQGTSATPWLTPGHRYRYILYNTSSGQTELDRTDITVPSLNCGTPPPSQLVCSITSASNVQVRQNVSFSASGGENLSVYSWSVNNTLLQQGFSTLTYNFSQPGTYRVILRSGNQTAECPVVVVTEIVTPQLQCSPTNQTVDINQTAFFSATGGTGTYSWSAPAGAPFSGFGQNFSSLFSSSGSKTVTVTSGNQSANCNVEVRQPAIVICPSGFVILGASNLNVGQTTQVFAPSGWSGGNFSSSNGSVASVSGSTVRGESVGSANITGFGFTAPNGAINCPLNPATVVVQQPTQTLSCVVDKAFANTDEIVTYTAIGGSGDFTWMGQTGNPVSSLNTNPFSTRHQTPGQKFVQVRRGSQTAECPVVTVQQPPQQTLSCSPTNQNVLVNQTAFLSATGGTGSYTWSAPSANNTSGSGQNFSVSYPNSAVGSRSVTVTSGNQSATCYVLVQTPPVQQLTCSPTNQTVYVNQTAFFSATGGTGTYTWSAPSSNVSSGFGMNFSTSYQSAGGRSVTVTSGNQTATCQVQVNSQPIVCVPNTNAFLTNDAIVQSGQNYRTNISYSFTGSNPVRLVYVNPDTGQEVELISSTSQTSGTRVLDQIQANKTYLVKLIDTSSCGGVIATLVVRKDVNPGQCVVNTNFALNFSQPAKQQSGNFSSTISWTSTGNNPIKITIIRPNNTGEEIFATGANSGSKIAIDLIPGRTYTFNMYDATCNVFLASAAVHIPSEPNPQVGYLNLNKQVKNITQNTNFAKTVTADNGNRVAYQITVTANLAAVNNVLLTESLPSGLSFISGSARLDNSGIGDITNNNQISLGNMSAGQSRVLYFESYAQSPFGQTQTVITNTATASGQNVPTVSDSATVYINTPNNPGFSQLNVVKSVRLGSGGNFQQQVNANNGDQVQFEIVITNTGTQTLNNVRVTDTLPSGLNFVSGSLQSDYGFSGGADINQMNLGSLNPGQQRRITFSAMVNNVNTNQSLQNIARAMADNVSQVQDDAWVFVSGQVNGGNVNLNYSKRAVNETKTTSGSGPVDATTIPASREDYITYTLTVNNTGNTQAQNFVITDDLSGVLPYADMVDNGGGALNGSVITYPGINIPAGGSVSKSFKVRVKYGLSANLSYTMTNTYGNTVSIQINRQVQGAFIAPKTGADTLGLLFAAMLTAGFAAYRKKELLARLILNN